MAEKEVSQMLLNLGNVHYPCGPLYQCIQKQNALFCMRKQELEAIYHLTESHCATQRFKVSYRYENVVKDLDKENTLNRDNISFQCNTTCINAKIDFMLKQIAEMPKEWTIIQITSQCNYEEVIQINPEKHYTNPLHIIVFNCGQNNSKPFCVTVDSPKDKISGNTIELAQELESIIMLNKTGLQSIHTKSGKFLNHMEQKKYSQKRTELNSRLKNVVKEVKENWLREWRCLLIGKYEDNTLETDVSQGIEDEVKLLGLKDVPEKATLLLRYLVKGSFVLSLTEIKNAVLYCFPHEDKAVRKKLVLAIRSFAEKHYIAHQRRHPVILVVDEKLDAFPWEMVDVLQDHPVSRMPSLHFTYALFKEHEKSIVNGLKVEVSSKKGKFIINPGLDLKAMELRQINFFRYWIPEWTGIHGVEPTTTEFEDTLKSCDLFVYSGHGNGAQFLSSERIDRIRINAVVFLFGCSSVKLTSIGPQVEMYSSHQAYLTACSPCILGMLWDVTDIDTDMITMEMFSSLVPSNAMTPWKSIDKQTWQLTGKITPLEQKVTKKDVKSESNILKDYNATVRSIRNKELQKHANELHIHEPEVLRALCKARYAAKNYIIQAACVARGLPVKID